MEIQLKEKYRTYTGDTNGGQIPYVQYGHSRRGNGNGRAGITTSEVLSARGRVTGPKGGRKVMVVNGLTGHRVMVDE